jgi:Mce-associated membrane protein
VTLHSGASTDSDTSSEHPPSGVDVKELMAVALGTNTTTETLGSEPADDVDDVETEVTGHAEGSSEGIAESTEDADGSPTAEQHNTVRRRISWTRILSYGVLPGVALLLACGAGYLKWQDSTMRASEVANIESVQAAKDSTTALLSYRPGTVEQDLTAAQDRLTGDFKDTYRSLTHDVVIPGAKQKQISAQASVPAAASVSATEDHAVALVFVNQTVVIGNGAPTATASSVKVTLDKVAGRWLISQFEPV